MLEGAAPLDRLSLNQITAERRSLEETVDACARHGMGWLGAWRHKVGPASQASRIIRDAGIKVSSLCRGGFFPAATASARLHKVEDNLHAIDEAAALGCDVLVLVCGPAPDRDIAGAREMVAEGIAGIVGHAKSCGVRLGIEPLHPMFAADRSVIVTLTQANEIAERFSPEQVGIIVDVFHVWWDPQVYEQIARAGSRILGFHVSDWAVSFTDPLMSRAMMGQGVIEIRKLRAAVERAAYTGPIEVEIFNEQDWSTPLDELIKTMLFAYRAFV